MTTWDKRTYKQNQEDLKTATSPYISDKGRVIKQLPSLDPWRVSRGDYPELSFIAKFGRNGAIASGVEEVIWDQADAVYTYMVTASTLYISSSDTTDNETVEVQGLDENWNVQTASATLNGFTFVPLSGLWLRVFRAKVTSATSPAGDIFIADDNTDAGGDGIPDTATNIKAKITVGKNQTNMAIYTVPAGYKGYLVDWYVHILRASGTTAVAADCDIYRRDLGSVFRSTQPIGIQNTGAGDHQYTWPYPIPLEPKTDIEVRVQPTGAAAAAAGFTVLLEKT
jgi:hypothetical protein